MARSASGPLALLLGLAASLLLPSRTAETEQPPIPAGEKGDGLPIPLILVALPPDPRVVSLPRTLF